MVVNLIQPFSINDTVEGKMIHNCLGGGYAFGGCVISAVQDINGLIRGLILSKIGNKLNSHSASFL